MMTLDVRRCAVGLLVLGALFALYLVYARIGGTPTVEVDVAEPSVQRAGEDDIGSERDEVGDIGGIGIGRVEKTRFLHTDESGQVDRVFGFEELLHRDGEQWGITDPFMKLFLPEFRCDVTADRGQVQVETAFGQPMANDALFEGNVVIHIVPTDPNDPKEAFIYLDDVAFIAEKSLFSSSGSVKFVSRSALLSGRGMELLYDSARSRLDLFRVIDLEALRLRSADLSELSDRTSDPSPGAASESAEVVGPQTADRPDRADANTPAGQHYECVFHKNVTIDTPERVIVARERLSFNNIFWPDSSSKDKGPDAAAGPNEPVTLPMPGPNALDTTPSAQLTLDAIPEESFDIVVTCDAGFVVAPRGTADRVAPVEASRDDVSAETAPAPDRERAVAERIDVDVATSNTTLVGPVEMTLLIDPNGLAGRQGAGAPLPMTITAQEAVRFLAASNQIHLDGGCRATVEQAEPNLSHEYTLLSPTFTLELVRDPNGSTPQEAVSLRRVSAGGGSATLHIVRRAGDELVGRTELRAEQIDYEADRPLFTAYGGPGALTVHNAQAPTEPTDPNAFGLDRPCYAVLRDFDLLTFSIADNRIVAEAEPNQVLLDYVPIDDGQFGPPMHASAGYFEIALRQTDAAQTELVSLTAARGVAYLNEAEDGYQFDGSRLYYQHDERLVTVVGNESHPCYFNGAPVDQIEWNIQTNEAKAEIVGPSTIQVNK